MKIRGFSDRTSKSYVYYIRSLLTYANKSPRYITTEDIKVYLEHLANQNKSHSTLNLAYSAIKFYFGTIMHRRFFVNLPRVKQEKKLPEVLHKQEIKKIFTEVTNRKHRLMLMTM